jgi:hypothetical protein
MTPTLDWRTGQACHLPFWPVRGRRKGSLVKSSAAQYRSSASAGGIRPSRCMSLLVLYHGTHRLVIFSTSPTVFSGRWIRSEKGDHA